MTMVQTAPDLNINPSTDGNSTQDRSSKFPPPMPKKKLVLILITTLFVVVVFVIVATMIVLNITQKNQNSIDRSGVETEDITTLDNEDLIDEYDNSISASSAISAQYDKSSLRALGVLNNIGLFNNATVSKTKLSNSTEKLENVKASIEVPKPDTRSVYEKQLASNLDGRGSYLYYQVSKIEPYTLIYKALKKANLPTNTKQIKVPVVIGSQATAVSITKREEYIGMAVNLAYATINKSHLDDVNGDGAKEFLWKPDSGSGINSDGGCKGRIVVNKKTSKKVRLVSTHCQLQAARALGLLSQTILEDKNLSKLYGKDAEKFTLFTTNNILKNRYYWSEFSTQTNNGHNQSPFENAKAFDTLYMIGASLNKLNKQENDAKKFIADAKVMAIRQRDAGLALSEGKDYLVFAGSKNCKSINKKACCYTLWGKTARYTCNGCMATDSGHMNAYVGAVLNFYNHDVKYNGKPIYSTKYINRLANTLGKVMWRKDWIAKIGGETNLRGSKATINKSKPTVINNLAYNHTTHQPSVNSLKGKKIILTCSPKLLTYNYNKIEKNRTVSTKTSDLYTKYVATINSNNNTSATVQYDTDVYKGNKPVFKNNLTSINCSYAIYDGVIYKQLKYDVYDQNANKLVAVKTKYNVPQGSYVSGQYADYINGNIMTASPDKFHDLTLNPHYTPGEQGKNISNWISLARYGDKVKGSHLTIIQDELNTMPLSKYSTGALLYAFAAAINGDYGG